MLVECWIVFWAKLASSLFTDAYEVNLYFLQILFLGDGVKSNNPFCTILKSKKRVWRNRNLIFDVNLVKSFEYGKFFWKIELRWRQCRGKLRASAASAVTRCRQLESLAANSKLRALNGCVISFQPSKQNTRYKLNTFFGPKTANIPIKFH